MLPEVPVLTAMLVMVVLLLVTARLNEAAALPAVTVKISVQPAAPAHVPAV